MLSLQFIRENPDIVRQALEKRHDSAPIDEILLLDSERRQKVTELEELRRARKEIARERKSDGATSTEGRDLRTRIRTLEEETRQQDEQLEEQRREQDEEHYGEQR